MDSLVNHYFQLFSHFCQKKRKIPLEWGSPVGQKLHTMAAGSLKSLLWSPAPSSPDRPHSLIWLHNPTHWGWWKPSFSWRQSLTLGRVWMKAPIRIQVPRLCPSASLWNGLFLQNRSDPILVPFNLKTLFSSLRGRSSWQPQNFSRVNQQLSSLKPWPPSCNAGDRGALGSLDLPRERATSVTVLKAASCAQELPELKSCEQPWMKHFC